MTKPTVAQVYMTPERMEALKAEHKRTYPEHGLSFSAWLLALIQMGRRTAIIERGIAIGD